jgi:hypothetical protein
VFRLEKVLWWKSQLEKEARIKRLETESQARALERQLDECRTQRESAPDEAGDLGDAEEWSRYLERMRQSEARLADRLQELAPILAERIRVHLELRRDVKGLEKLSEKEELRRRKRIEKRAQEGLDESGSRRHLPGSGKTFRPIDRD